jgi:hypothetical protein
MPPNVRAARLPPDFCQRPVPQIRHRKVFAIHGAPSFTPQSSVRPRKLPCRGKRVTPICRIGWLIAQHARRKTIITGGRPSDPGDARVESNDQRHLQRLKIILTAATSRRRISSGGRPSIAPRMGHQEPDLTYSRSSRSEGLGIARPSLALIHEQICLTVSRCCTGFASS